MPLTHNSARKWKNKKKVRGKYCKRMKKCIYVRAPYMPLTHTSVSEWKKYIIKRK